MNIIEMRELFDYQDGKLIWKVKLNKRIVVGSEAGTLSLGRKRVQVHGRFYFVHRIVWALFNDEPPKFQIDHIDNNPLNNRIENLRLATPNQNQYNQRRQKNNSSGIKNVSWAASCNKWNVRVSAGGIRHNFGFFDDIELAELVALEARSKLHKEYANHG